MLCHAGPLAALVRFCAREYNEENVMCWVAIRDLKAAAREGKPQPVLRALAQDIVKQVCVEKEEGMGWK